jgi:hypothetical protein
LTNPSKGQKTKYRQSKDQSGGYIVNFSWGKMVFKWIVLKLHSTLHWKSKIQL